MASNKAKTRQKTYSGIEHHKLKGKTLTALWANVPNSVTFVLERRKVTEFLWACILASCIDRAKALATFRRLINYIEKNAREAYDKITHTDYHK